MAGKDKGKSGLISHGVVAQNRKARFDYTIKETIEAGMVLKGPEVKSLRLGRATLNEAWAQGRIDEAMALQDSLLPLHDALFVETNPAPVKYGLSLLGFTHEACRLPLAPLGALSRDRVHAAMGGLRLI